METLGWVLGRRGFFNIRGGRGLALFVAVVSCFCFCFACGKREGQGGLQVTSATPSGETSNPINIVVVFSKPMVAESQIGKDSTSTVLKIDPEIEGFEVWEDAQTLTFLPSKPLPLSTRYRIVISDRLKATDGTMLDEPYEFEITTHRLKGEFSVLGSEARATAMQQIKLDFNQEVDAEAIQEHCGFESESRRFDVDFSDGHTEAQGRIFVVAPSGKLNLDTVWRFKCDGSLKGVVGNIGIGDAKFKEFRTYGPLTYISHEPSGTDIVPTEGQQLSIAFSNPLKEPYQMTLEPKVKGFPERCYNLGDAPPGIACDVSFEPRTHYTLTVKQGQEDSFAQTLAEDKVIRFRTTDSEPTLSMESGFVIAELGRPVLPIWGRNVKTLRVRAVSFEPKTMAQVAGELNWWDEGQTEFQDTSLKDYEGEIRVGGENNKWKQVAIDPATLLGRKPGPGMYYIEIGSDEVSDYPFGEGGVRKTLVNFTNIGVVSKISASRGLIWATELSTGGVLAGAEVTVRNEKGKVTFRGKTDKDGLATLPGLSTLKGKGEEARIRVFVGKNDDWTMIDPLSQGGLANWNFNVSTDFSSSPESLRGFMHTDRGLYRPGETVHIKGLARVTSLAAPLKVPSNKEAEIEIRGPRRSEVFRKKLALSQYGGFWSDFEIPKDARLGDYVLVAHLKSGTFTERFSVEEFRPASFEVQGSAKQKRLVRNGIFNASINADYFYGAPLREGRVDMTVHTRPRERSFSGHPGFSFNNELAMDRNHYYGAPVSQALLTESSLALDPQGRAQLSYKVSEIDIDTDSDLLVRAKVVAPSNEVIQKTFTLPYFKYNRYFGMKAPGYFLAVKEPQTFQVLTVNPEGVRVKGKAKVKVERADWNCVWEEWGYRGSYHCRENRQTVLDTQVDLSAVKNTPVTFTPKAGGEYWVSVSGEKEQSVTSRRFYAWGDGGGSWQSSDSMTFDLIADKKNYKVGDTATLIMKTDLANASGLVTIERDGVIEKRLIALTPESKVIQVPITENFAPNVYVSVALVQGRMGEGKRGKPRMRMGLVNLSVKPEDTTLTVQVTTDKPEYRPGESVEAQIRISDQRGRPVLAEVALSAADEGVLSLTAFKTPDPVPTFYSPWGLGVMSAAQFEYLRDIPGPNVSRPATGGDSGGPGSIRSRFLASAFWKPGIVTDKRGRATLRFEAPDNLTAFRVMAVAADRGDRFGSGDLRFTVSKPLQLHRTLPRFLTMGDSLRGGVVVHNETGSQGQATVTMALTGAVSSDGELVQVIDVPKGGKVPVLFPIQARDAGTGVLDFSVTMNDESDRVQFLLPVHHPSPVQSTHVAHGVVEGEKSIEVELPAGAILSSARLNFSVDAHGLAGLEDSLRNLVGYPYGCLEQTTSKVIPMLALRDLAEGLKLDSLGGEKIDEFVKAGIGKIGRHQKARGGFSLWPGGEPSTYYTAYALWGLHLAKEAGYTVDPSRVEDGLNYLRYYGIRPNTSDDHYDPMGNLGNQAFALYVRAMLGDGDAQAAAKLRENWDDLPVYGQAFLVRAMAASLGRDDSAVAEDVAKLAALATEAEESKTLIQEKKSLGYYMSSSLRSSAVVLETLVELLPEHRSIPKLVRTIMEARRASPYLTTQENIYSLLALRSYSETQKGNQPQVSVRLGDERVYQGALQGKNRIGVGSTSLPSKRVSLVFTSKGKAHYNVELSYREEVEALSESSHGLTYKREMLDANNEPVGEFRVGDVVKVRITIPLGKSISHLMVSDKIPAGFEALNTRLKTVGTTPANLAREPWGTFREIHDDGVDLSSEYVWRSTYVREYMMRAIAEGQFVLPPSRAELMYEPQTHAQTAVGRVEIRAR